MIQQDRVTLSDRDLEIIAESVDEFSLRLGPGALADEYAALVGRLRHEQAVRAQRAAHADDMQQSGG